MALSSITQAVPSKLGGSGFENDTAILTALSECKTVLSELRELKVSLVNGAAAESEIAVAGLTATAVILAAVSLQPVDGLSGDLVDNVADEITVLAGKVTFSTTNTTGRQILLVYFNI